MPSILKEPGTGTSSIHAAKAKAEGASKVAISQYETGASSGHSIIEAGVERANSLSQEIISPHTSVPVNVTV